MEDKLKGSPASGFSCSAFPGGDYSAALGPPDPPPPQPRRPLQLHPSPKDENRRQNLTVNRKASYQPTFSQLDGDGDPPPSPPTSTLLPTQSSPPVTPPRTSRPYPHPPPLSPKAKSELMMIPPKSENYCCHCRTECPCTFGYSCRGCPARKGGRPHHCDRCPGNWCHIKPPDFL